MKWLVTLVPEKLWHNGRAFGNDSPGMSASATIGHQKSRTKDRMPSEKPCRTSGLPACLCTKRKLRHLRGASFVIQAEPEGFCTPRFVAPVGRKR